MNQQEHINAYLDIKNFFLNPEYDMFLALTNKNDLDNYDNILESLHCIYAIKSNIKACDVQFYDDGTIALLLKKNHCNNSHLTI